MWRLRHREPSARRWEQAWRDVEAAGLRVVSGRRLSFGQRRAGLVVLASDIDEDAGVAVVWLVQRAGLPDGAEYMLQFERVGRWLHVGAGGGSAKKLRLADRPSAVSAGPGAMMTILGGCSWPSRADRQAQSPERDITQAGWGACAAFRLAREVAYLQVGARRINVPGHGYAIVAWKAPPSIMSLRRPAIVAVGADDCPLTELGPDDHVDSLTWAAIEAASAEGNLA